MGFDTIEINLVKTGYRKDLLPETKLQICYPETNLILLANPCEKIVTFRDYGASCNFFK